MMLSPRYWPEASAAAMMNGLMLEPGSKMSVARAVAIELEDVLAAVVRVERRLVDHREHLAGVAIDDDRPSPPAPGNPASRL